jgi:hypothetical protein
MKNITFLILFFSIVFSSFAQAGAIKDLIIETDEMIHYEFYKNAHREVVSISNHQFISSRVGIDVKAEVVTRHPENGVIQDWTCVVKFKKFGRNYEAQDIDCR